MKKIILYIIVFIIIMVFILLIISIAGKLKDKKAGAERIEHLPEFSLMDISCKSFAASEIKQGPLLILYFHPECEHCYYEISELFRRNDLESNIRLILVTSAPRDLVAGFIEKISTEKIPDSLVLIDSEFVFRDIFGIKVIPSAFLYDRNLKLINTFYGEYKIESIIQKLKLSEQIK